MDRKLPNVNSLGRYSKSPGTWKKNLLQIHPCRQYSLHEAEKFRPANLDFRGAEGKGSEENSCSLLKFIRLQPSHRDDIFAHCFLACPEGA